MQISTKNNRYHYLSVAAGGVIALLLSGCLATKNLLIEDNLDERYKRVAFKIAERAMQICTTHTYEQGSNRKLSGDMRITKLPEVKRLYESKSGLWKSELMVSGVWDNVYYLERSEIIICGEIQWQQFPQSKEINFTEVKPGVSNQNILRDANIGINREDGLKEYAIAFSWRGIGELMAGRVSIRSERDVGFIRLNLPTNQGICSGSFKISGEAKGVWSISCTNGVTASGDLSVNRSIAGSSGTGLDNKGGQIKFTIGEAL